MPRPKRSASPPASARLGFEAELWAAANALRGSIECGNATRRATADIPRRPNGTIELNPQMSQKLEATACVLSEAWFLQCKSCAPNRGARRRLAPVPVPLHHIPPTPPVG
jgi:hypothetical protein